MEGKMLFNTDVNCVHFRLHKQHDTLQTTKGYAYNIQVND